MNGRLRRALLYASVATAWLAGCSIIVPGDVPEYRCNGAEDPSSCPPGLVCDSASLRCVAPSGVPDGSDDVLTEEDAGEEAGPDGPTGPSPLGGDCSIDGDCASGLLCGTSTILTTAIAPANSPFCTKPCCTSEECTAGFVCFPAATGGNYCVPAAKANRKPAATAGRAGGATCADPDDCRSGLCTAGRCVDTCCEPKQCAAGTTCRIAMVSGHTGWACGAPNGGAAQDLEATCVGNSDCKNDNCVQPFSANKRCTPPCCNASDCSSLGFANNVCAYGSDGNDHIKWCWEPNASGKALGASCNGNEQCASRYCDSELGRCANVCCTNSDCGNGESCRPSPGSTPFLRCVKNR